jgi:hypothetical protein
LILSTTGLIWANKTADDFDQSIPTEIINILFFNPVHLTNLHQLWFMNQRRQSASNTDVAIQIYFASRRTNFSYEYQPEWNISQSFCDQGEFNRTFDVNPSESMKAIDFLCNNLSAIELKSFLIDVQTQLDEKFLVREFQCNSFF